MHPAYAALLAEARSVARAEGASVEYANGRKHAFLVVRQAGDFRKLTLSHGTKNMKHQTDWVRQNTRRALREMQIDGPVSNGGAVVSQTEGAGPSNALTAQAIETQRAKTEGLGPKDESAVAVPCAQTGEA